MKEKKMQIETGNKKIIFKGRNLYTDQLKQRATWPRYKENRNERSIIISVNKY